MSIERRGLGAPVPPPHRAGPRRPRAFRQVPAAVGVFVGVLLSLQVFLLTVAVDALLADDTGLAWVTSGLSVLLAAGAAAFYRSLR
jgi:hypothetical protein